MHLRYRIIQKSQMKSMENSPSPLCWLQWVGMDVYPGGCLSKAIFPSFSRRFKLKLLKNGEELILILPFPRNWGKKGSMDNKAGMTWEGLENSWVVEDPSPR